jgi:hypothetical protein
LRPYRLHRFWWLGSLALGPAYQGSLKDRQQHGSMDESHGTPRMVERRGEAWLNQVQLACRNWYAKAPKRPVYQGADSD